MKNDVCLLISTILDLLQEIHTKPGKAAYNDRRFLTNISRTCLIAPAKKFEVFVERMKQDWIMEKITHWIKVISHLEKMYKNMLAKGTWKSTNKKNSKVVALTSQLRQTNDKLGKVQKQLEVVKHKKGKRCRAAKAGKANGKWEWRQADHEGQLSSMVSQQEGYLYRPPYHRREIRVVPSPYLQGWLRQRMLHEASP